MMNVVYMGTAEIAAPVLERLAADPDVRIVGVVSQPDRPAGRNRVMTPSPVSHMARRLGLPLITPERIADPDSIEWLRARAPDINVVFAFGQFLPRTVRELPRFGSINIHPSRLPLYRGAAPIPWAIANGDTTTAVSIIRMEKEMDAGDVLVCRSLDIAPDDTAATLGPRAAALGADLVLETLRCMKAGTLVATAQDSTAATHARKLEKSDARLDWTQSAVVLNNRIRAFDPWPGTVFATAAQPAEFIKVWRARVEEGSGALGTVLEIGCDGPLVACGSGALRLLEVQAPGRRRMSAGEAARGAGWQAGTAFT